MIAVLVAVVLAANPAKEPVAKEQVHPVHRLRCGDGRRLFEALRTAGVAVTTQGKQERIELKRLTCGMGKAPTFAESRVSCSEPAISGDAAKQVWSALTAARMKPAQGAMQAGLDLTGVACTSGPEGAECTLTNEAVYVDLPPSGNRDVRSDGREYDPKSACPPKP